MLNSTIPQSTAPSKKRWNTPVITAKQLSHALFTNTPAPNDQLYGGS